MHLLLESHETKVTPLGAVVSLGVHALLAFVILAAYQTRFEDSQESFDEFAMFLVPPDRAIYVDGSDARYKSGTQGDGKNPGEKGLRGGGKGTDGTFSMAAGDTAASTQLSIDLPNLIGDTVLTEIEVDSAVRRYEWSASPSYPITMLQQNIEGAAFVIYVVDTLGHADTTSFKIVNSTREEFAQAVRDAMPKMRFRPAILGGMKVRQLVQQSFSFKIQRPDSVLPPIKKPSL
jgi:hypothetical protein